MKCHEAINALMKWYPLSLDDLDGEIWRAIEGFDGYQVSNFGRVKSFMHKHPRILKPIPFHLSNYLCTQIYKGKERFYLSIHRLVAQAFIPNPENKPQVNHVDGHKLNNHFSNLEWVTVSENMLHARDTGLLASGENSVRALLTNEQIKWARSVFKPYDKEFGGAALARKLGVCPKNMNLALHGKSYRQADGQFHKTKLRRVPDDVREEIRRLYVKGSREFGAEALAKRFGVGSTTVSVIVNET